MTDQLTWERVDTYFSELLVQSDPVLEMVLERAARAGMPAINVSPNQGKLLHLIARIRGARRILEVGTLAGYSTIWLARALPTGGQLISLEHEPLHAEVARQNIKAAELDDLVEIIEDNALSALDRLVAENTEPFDFIFLDADKENNAAYLERALALSRPGTVIVGDNVVRKGRVVEEGNVDADVLGTRRFIERLAGTAVLDSTAIQTVGSKGWDGFSISVVSE